MKTWYDATKEDIELELAPGITTVNHDAISQLDWATYLEKLDDLVGMGINTNVGVAKDQIENVMVDTLIEAFRVMERSGPSPDEIFQFLHHRNTVVTKQNLLFLCLNATEDNWPEVKATVAEALGLTL